MTRCLPSCGHTGLRREISRGHDQISTKVETSSLRDAQVPGSADELAGDLGFDRGDRLREVPRYLSPESEHWLEWFHITTRHYCDGRDGEGYGRSLGFPGMKVTDGAQAHQQLRCWWAIGAQHKRTRGATSRSAPKFSRPLLPRNILQSSP